jgi:peptide/nickel transport system permease protein
MSFLLLSLVPGDPAAAILGENASEEAVGQVRKDLGLDRPLLVRYVTWLADAFSGDLGRSYVDRRPVAKDIRARFPVTVELTLLSILLATAIAVPLGTLAGLRWGSKLDRGITGIAVAGVAVPGFFLAVVLVLIFGVELQWLPVLGWVPFSEDPGEHIKHLVLPVITMAAAPTAVIARMVRASVSETIRQDYVRTARAKGLGERTVVLRHALRNALIPTVTIIGLQLGVFLGGAIVIESIFGLPGLGLLSLRATSFHDYPTLQAVVVIMATGVLLVNLLVDSSYVLLDPRIRHR